MILSTITITQNEVLPADSVARVHLRVRQATQALQEGQLETARARTTEARELLHSSQPQRLATLTTPYIDFAEGLLERASGNYQSAHRLLGKAQLDSVTHELLLAPAAIQEWGNFLWECGLYKEALHVHADGTSRALIAAASTDLLVRSHLSAAKCAIDLEDLSLADRELGAAEQLIRESDDITELSKGYYALRNGEYLLAKGADEARGSALIEEACAVFQKMDPPCHPGMLDSKIVLTRAAIQVEDHVRLSRILNLLFDEAEEHGCLEARARLLVLESAMWVSDNPPLEEGFENLALRVNLINNPALMMQACANLYLYSLRYLDKPSQAFMLARLRRLQSVLDKSCYQDLYEKYIESRYCWAVEGRLARFLDEEKRLFDEPAADFDEEEDDEEDDYDLDDDLESTL